MANDDHLRCLHRGVEAWNAWRNENPGIRPDLSGATLDGTRFVADDAPTALNLSGVNLSKAVLRDLDLASAVSDLDLFKAELTRVRFRGQLKRVNFRRATLEKVAFQDVKFDACPFAGARIDNSSFQGAKFLAATTDAPAAEGDEAPRENSLESAECHLCDFRDAELNRISLSSARLEGCDLRGVDGLVLDDNVLRGTLMSPKATDHWSEMRRTYTGANMVFILLASVVFFLPWIFESAVWLGANQAELRLSAVAARADTALQQHPPGSVERRVLETLSAARVDDDALACIGSHGANDAGNGEGDNRCFPLWKLLLGWHEGLGAALVSGLLLLYNMLRLVLTWLVAPLRDEERHSFHSPCHSPVGCSGLECVKALRYCYGWMVAPHKAANFLFYISFLFGALNLLSRVTTQVWLPEM